MYRLRFELSNEDYPMDNYRTVISKTFDPYMGSEFETVVEEIKLCLLACGYSEELIKDYFGE